MKTAPLLMSLLLTFTAYSQAGQVEDIQAQHDTLKQEIRRIEQEARSEQERLEALKRLIEEQREKNSELDRALETERLKQLPDEGPEPPKE
ncbi:MAG: hypothetical protein OQL20_05430 [Sedimenticola sp.]|nr:hypothetical protein [Sedimenticola sp.]